MQQRVQRRISNYKIVVCGALGMRNTISLIKTFKWENN